MYPCDTIKLLLNLGADVNKCDNQGGTPLHTNCDCNANENIIRFLIDNGTNIETVDLCGNTFLHSLARENNIYNAENKYRTKNKASAIQNLFANGYIKKEYLTIKNKYEETSVDIANDSSFGYTKKAFQDIHSVI